MFVSDVRPSEAIYSYNSIKLNVLRKEIVEADRADSAFDMKKVLADVAKDFSLQQYQYFVRRSDADSESTPVFRTGANFVL